MTDTTSASTQTKNASAKVEGAGQAAPSATPAAVPDSPLVRPDFSGRRLRLGAKPVPGFHLCWVNDTGTNVEEYLSYGYTFVTPVEQDRPVIPGRGQDLGDQIRASVGEQADGTPMYAFLMKIPDLLFSEGMRSIDARNRAVQDSLRRTFKHAQGLGESKDAGQFYAPQSNTFESQSSKAPSEKR